MKQKSTNQNFVFRNKRNSNNRAIEISEFHTYNTIKDNDKKLFLNTKDDDYNNRSGSSPFKFKGNIS